MTVIPFFRGRRVLKGSQIEMLVNSTCPWCMKTTLPFRMQTLSLYCIDCPSHLDGELPQRERLCFCCSAHLLSPKRALLSAPEPAFCHQDRGCKESCDSLCIQFSLFCCVRSLLFFDVATTNWRLRTRFRRTGSRTREERRTISLFRSS